MFEQTHRHVVSQDLEEQSLKREMYKKFFSSHKTYSSIVNTILHANYRQIYSLCSLKGGKWMTAWVSENLVIPDDPLIRRLYQNVVNQVSTGRESQMKRSSVCDSCTCLHSVPRLSLEICR